MPDVLGFFTDPANWDGPRGIPWRMVEHVLLSGLAILIATGIGLPVGLYIGHTGRGAGLAISLANIGRAVPSYAILVMVLPVARRWRRSSGTRRHWDSTSCRSSSR